MKIAKLKLIREWFLSNSIADFGRPVENYFLSTLLPRGFDKSKDVQESVVHYLSAFDPSIIGFKVETLDSGDDTEIQKVRN